MDGSVGLAVSKSVMREIDSRSRSGYLVDTIVNQACLGFGSGIWCQFWVKGDAVCGSYTSVGLKLSIILVQKSGLER
jgi:hypothetical protein